MFCPSWIYLRGARCTEGIFAAIFRQYTVGETKKPSSAHHINVGSLGAASFGKYGRGYCIAFMKRLDKCLRLQFLRQNSSFLPAVHLNWLAKF